MTLPFIPMKLRGGKNEEWQVYLAGQPLIPHPTFGDKASILIYIELLQQEVADGTFSTNPEPSETLQRIQLRRDLGSGSAQPDLRSGVVVA